MTTVQTSLPMVAHWHENQIVITFRSNEQLSPATTGRVIASLHLDRLNQFLTTKGFTLTSFSDKDLFRIPQRDDPSRSNSSPQENAAGSGNQAPNVNSPSGKYLFRTPDGKGTSVIAFFHVDAAPGTATTPATAGNNQGQDPYATGGAGTGTAGGYYANDITMKVTCLINEHLHEFKQVEVPIVSAMPNWLKGGAKCIIEGCPITPPLPVDTVNVRGRWKFMLPRQVEESLQKADGRRVTVLVLDTLRPYADVSAVAASDAGAKNALLQDIVKNVTFSYNDLPEVLNDADDEQPVIGKDVYGRQIGFPMSDHGIFVAGIIRDIAPGARIECIRVLNDFGGGNTTGLMYALEQIQNRLQHQEGAGSPLNLPLVVNLSLVGTPPDEVLMTSPYNLNQTQVYQLREGLYEAIQSLTAQGVVFVAAAGNDSELRNSSSLITLSDGTTIPKRFQPRYPAAFAYDESAPGQPTRSGIPTVIPVGAVNQTGNAASYSNYPGTVGIATYGGELPTPDPEDAPPTPPLPPPYGTRTKIAEPIDAVRGVYTCALF
ncbi:MAG: S8 family serine peptidase, partial [Ktedonobacteraceae bacterium]|nr:S8 family serine peptidase [Ktedonobacteraceae bacterium]